MGSECSKSTYPFPPQQLQNIRLKRKDNNTYLNIYQEYSAIFNTTNKPNLSITPIPYQSGTKPDPKAGTKGKKNSFMPSLSTKDCPKDAKIKIYSYRKIGGVTPFKITMFYNEPITDDIGVPIKDDNGIVKTQKKWKELIYKGGQILFVKESSYDAINGVDTDPSMIGKLFYTLKAKGGGYVIKIYGTKMFLGVNDSGMIIPIPPGGSPLGKVVSVIPTNTKNNLQVFMKTFSNSTITYQNQNGPIAGQSSQSNTTSSPDEVPDEPEGITTTKQPGNEEVTERDFPDAKTNLSPEQQESVQNPSTEQQQENTERELFSSIEGTEIAIIVTLAVVVGVVIAALLVVFLRKNPSPSDVTTKFGSFFGRRRSRR